MSRNKRLERLLFIEVLHNLLTQFGMIESIKSIDKEKGYFFYMHLSVIEEF